MVKAKKIIESSKSNKVSKFKPHYKSRDKKAREIKSSVILDQLDKLKKKGLINQEEYERRKKQIFGLNNEISREKKR